MKNNMSNINFTNKINLPIVGEIDLYHIKSISVLSDTDTYYFDTAFTQVDVSNL